MRSGWFIERRNDEKSFGSQLLGRMTTDENASGRQANKACFSLVVDRDCVLSKRLVEDVAPATLVKVRYFFRLECTVGIELRSVLRRSDFDVHRLKEGRSLCTRTIPDTAHVTLSAAGRRD